MFSCSSVLMKIVVSVPGKIILSGEHAVVYGKPAIAAAVDRRLTVTLQTRDDGERVIHTDASDTKLIKTAIKVVRDELKLRKNTNDCYLNFAKNGYEIKVESEIPVGAGMGSSAAVIAGVTAAFWVGVTETNKLNPKVISELTIKAERINYPNESGLDPTTVCFGGLIWYRKELEFLKTFWKLQFKIAKSIDKFYLLNTGKPEESTKEMVSLVKQKYCKKHITIVSSFLQLLSKFEEATKHITHALKEENEKALIQSIRENERLLEELGVVGEFTKGIVREIESTGGVAKISGAGGVKDKSGLLLIYHKDKDKDAVKEIAKKHKLTYFPAKLGVEGLWIESITI